MARDPRYGILFEPVRIGPVTARNRFYQVPHSDGLGHRRSKAEGVHKHGAPAGIELVHDGPAAANRAGREVPRSGAQSLKTPAALAVCVAIASIRGGERQS